MPGEKNDKKEKIEKPKIKKPKIKTDKHVAKEAGFDTGKAAKLSKKVDAIASEAQSTLRAIQSQKQSERKTDVRSLQKSIQGSDSGRRRSIRNTWSEDIHQDPFEEVLERRHHYPYFPSSRRYDEPSAYDEAIDQRRRGWALPRRDLNRNLNRLERQHEQTIDHGIVHFEDMNRMLPRRRNIHDYSAGYRKMERKIKRNPDTDVDHDANSERTDVPDADQSNEREIEKRG